MNVLQLLQQKFHAALGGLVADPTPYVAMVKPVQDAKHGDYQANCAMPLKAVLGKNPREIAAAIVARLDKGDMLEPPEIAGPGFINLRLRNDWLASRLQEIAADERLGVPQAEPPRTVVIDFSSPNVAKPMHVGNLRSTIIGDALARLLRLLGHRVITDNHLGDWGTQFGMLLYGYKHFRNEDALKEDPVREMVRLYVLVRQQMRSDEDEENVPDPVADAAREETAKLHAGDPENVALWQKFMPWCLEEINRIYRRLDVHFDHTHGESFYNPMLPDVVADLQQRGLARESNGAVAIFFGEDEPPALVRKTDGAFTYTTSDLATIRYRQQTWNPDTVLYVVDARQALHFKNLFEAARRWGFTDVALEHLSFGSVLGPDRKPIKTREGGAVELGQLLDEAVERGRQVYQQQRAERLARGEEVPPLSPEDEQRIAQVVGLGAVKYADLSQNRTTDYVFNWDKMLAMDGNTATYMQYAYARNRSIFRKGNEQPERFRNQPPVPSLAEPQERALAVQLLRLPEALQTAAQEYRPNLITAYLWDLARTYSGFFENCPVLKAPTPALRESRLLLCDLTARTIQIGLSLLGIQTIERM
ncbi:MAG TPA: arginine--tRNA ligase [Gemmataceae bacterium]|nr:arginine--tRNA ligase [Gemmataceae bacterium]